MFHVTDFVLDRPSNLLNVPITHTFFLIINPYKMNLLNNFIHFYILYNHSRLGN